jgi:hypothetical protein
MNYHSIMVKAGMGMGKSKEESNKYPLRTMDRSVDRLSVVSKIILDQRFLELKRENEVLRSDLAWCKYGPQQLELWMPSVNMDEVCTCQACFDDGRLKKSHLDRIFQGVLLEHHGYDGLAMSAECIVRKCLVMQAEALGLNVIQHDIMSNPYVYVDPRQLDCHIAILRRSSPTGLPHPILTNSWYIAYGRMLPKENFHLNPAFKSIEKLFDLCEAGTEFFQIDGRDYADD